MSETTVNLDELIGEKWSFFTSSGLFSGTITKYTPIESGGYGISMKDVIYRPHGSFFTQLNLPDCVVYSRHIVASTICVEPITVREDE